MTTITSWVVLFCRVTLALAFSLSAISKIFKMQPFVKAVANFKILPNQFTRFASYLFVTGETLAAILLILGYLPQGFVLAGLLLLVFSSALAVVLWRKMHISCNCFGSAETIISIYDLWRNGFFVVCSIVGLVTIKTSVSQPGLTILDDILVIIMAMTFVTIWTNLNDIAWLLQKS